MFNLQQSKKARTILIYVDNKLYYFNMMNVSLTLSIIMESRVENTIDLKDIKNI